MSSTTLSDQLKELASLAEAMEKKGKLSSIDKDLLKSRFIGLYDQLLRNEDNIQESTDSEEIISNDQTLKMPEKESAQRMETSSSTKGSLSQAETIIEKSVEEVPHKTGKPHKTKAEEDALIPTRMSKMQKKEEIPSIISEKPGGIIAEKYEGSRKFFNEQLAETFRAGKKDLASSLVSKPIDNMESAIGLNEKFLFVKELFSGNAQLYKETVETIDRATGFDEALQFISSHFSWDPKDPIVQKFLDLVHRKHFTNHE